MTNGVDLSAKDSQGRNVLHYCGGGSLVSPILIDDTRTRSKVKEDIGALFNSMFVHEQAGVCKLDQVLLVEQDSMGWTPLHAAAAQGNGTPFALLCCNIYPLLSIYTLY